MTDVDFDTFDSKVQIYVDGHKTETIREDNGHEIEYYTEGRICHDIRLCKSMVNFDHYLSDPRDFMADYDSVLDPDVGTVITVNFADPDVVFQVYQEEIEAAAQVRSDEDRTTTVRVLAGWLNLAISADHVDRAVEDILYHALANQQEATGNTDWGLAYNGDPDGPFGADANPPTTLEAVREVIDD